MSELGAGDLKPHAKTRFSMLTESVENDLKSLGSPKQAILCGIEAQACIAVNLTIFLSTIFDICLQTHSRVQVLSYNSVCSVQHTIFWNEVWRFTSLQTLSQLGGNTVHPESMCRYCSTTSLSTLTLTMDELKMCVMLVPQSDRPAVCSLTSKAEWSFSHHH